MKNCKLFLVLIFIAFCIACDQPTIGKDDDNDETVETELIPLDRDPVIEDGFQRFEAGSGYLYRMAFTPQYYEQRIDENIWMIHQPLIKGAYGMGGEKLVFATSENLEDSGITICSGRSYDVDSEGIIQYSSGFGSWTMHWLLFDLHIIPTANVGYKWNTKFLDRDQELYTEVNLEVIEVKNKIITTKVEVINYEGFTGNGIAIYNTDVGLISFKGYNSENKLEVLYELKEAKKFKKTTVSGTVTFNNQTVENYNVSPYNIPTVATNAEGFYAFDIYADDVRLYHGNLLWDGDFDYDNINRVNLSNVGVTVTHNIVLEEEPVPPEPPIITPENPTPVIENGFTPYETGSGYLYRMSLLPEQSYGYLADDTIWVIHQPIPDSLSHHFDPMFAFFTSENVNEEGFVTYYGGTYSKDQADLRSTDGFGDNGPGSGLLIQLSRVPKAEVNSGWDYEYTNFNNKLTKLVFTVNEVQNKTITASFEIINYDNFTGSGTAIYNTDVGLISFKGYDSENKLAVLFELKEAKMFEKTTVSGKVTENGNPIENYNVSPYNVPSVTTDSNGNYSFDIYADDLRIYYGELDSEGYFDSNTEMFDIFENIGSTLTHNIEL